MAQVKAGIDIVTGLADLADKITGLVQKQIAYAAKFANDANNDYNWKTHFLDNATKDIDTLCQAKYNIPIVMNSQADSWENTTDFQELPVASVPISNAATVTYKIWILTSGKYTKRRAFGVDNWQIVGNFEQVSKIDRPFQEPVVTYLFKDRKPLTVGPSAVGSGGVDGAVKVGGWTTIPKPADPTPAPAPASTGPKILGIYHIPAPVPKPAAAQPPVKPVPTPNSKPVPSQQVADPARLQPSNPAVPDQPIDDTYSDEPTNGVPDQLYDKSYPDQQYDESYLDEPYDESYPDQAYESTA